MASNNGELAWLNSLSFSKVQIAINYTDSTGKALNGIPDLILEDSNTIVLVEYKHGGLLNNATCKNSADKRISNANCKHVHWLNQLAWSNSIYKIIDLQRAAQEQYNKNVISVVVNPDYKLLGIKVASGFK